MPIPKESKVFKHLKAMAFKYQRFHNRIVSNTLEGYVNKIGRVQGNSLRQIDLAIQLLFGGNIVVCLDHHENGEHQIANRMLLERIIRRLEFEHSRWNNGEEKFYIVDKTDCIVYLKEGIV